MQSLRRSSHFPSLFTLISPFPMLTLPLLLAHFKLSHVGGCQTGAPQCGVSLIRTDRHQRESAACVCGLPSRRLIFIFIFSPRLPRGNEALPSSVFVMWVQLHLFTGCFLSLPRPSQSRLGSQSDAMAIQSIRNVRGNSFCVDCDAPSMSHPSMKLPISALIVEANYKVFSLTTTLKRSSIAKLLFPQFTPR